MPTHPVCSFNPFPLLPLTLDSRKTEERNREKEILEFNILFIVSCLTQVTNHALTTTNVHHPLNNQIPITPTLGNEGVVFLKLLPAVWERWYLSGALRQWREWSRPKKASCNTGCPHSVWWLNTELNWSPRCSGLWGWKIVTSCFQVVLDNSEEPALEAVWGWIIWAICLVFFGVRSFLCKHRNFHR